MEHDEFTEDDAQTLDELYRQQWFAQLSPEQQELALLHHIDQFEAVPSYAERYATSEQKEQTR